MLSGRVDRRVPRLSLACRHTAPIPCWWWQQGHGDFAGTSREPSGTGIVDSFACIFVRGCRASPVQVQPAGSMTPCTQLVIPARILRNFWRDLPFASLFSQSKSTEHGSIEGRCIEKFERSAPTISRVPTGNLAARLHVLLRTPFLRLESFAYTCNSLNRYPDYCT